MIMLNQHHISFRLTWYYTTTEFTLAVVEARVVVPLSWVICLEESLAGANSLLNGSHGIAVISSSYKDALCVYQLVDKSTAQLYTKSYLKHILILFLIIINHLGKAP